MGGLGGNGGVSGLEVVTPGPNGEVKPKEKKQPPISKQLASKLSQCSQRLAEILSWQAKLDEASGKLILV